MKMSKIKINIFLILQILAFGISVHPYEHLISFNFFYIFTDFKIPLINLIIIFVQILTISSFFIKLRVELLQKLFLFLFLFYYIFSYLIINHFNLGNASVVGFFSFDVMIFTIPLHILLIVYLLTKLREYW
jgi:hypothetical protein